MDKEVLDYIKVCEYSRNFTSIEKEAFYAELLGTAIFGKKGDLLEFLLKDDLKSFRNCAEFMNEEGARIKATF